MSLTTPGLTVFISDVVSDAEIALPIFTFKEQNDSSSTSVICTVQKCQLRLDHIE